MKIYQTKENFYIYEILNEICKDVFSARITALLDINFELNSIKCIVNVGENTLYIKFSSVQSFIKKDYDINWILQDLNLCLEPITLGFLKTKQLYYSVFNFNKFTLLAEEKIELSLIHNLLHKYHSIKIEKNSKIENYKDFFLRKFSFDNFYHCFQSSLKDDFFNLTYYYGEIYEKLQSKIKKNFFDQFEEVLLHGDLGENSIILQEKNIYLYNFENSFYGHPVIDVCLLDINLKLHKNSFLKKNLNYKDLNLDMLLTCYELCLLKKAMDFIFDIIFKYFSKEINGKDKLTKSFLDLNFFSQVEEINLVKKSLTNIINHSNV